jgi:signal recognition particle subunit SRP54
MGLMFESLSERLGAVFEGLTRRGALKEADVGEAMREVRVALLEADVALDVVKGFIERVQEKAVGQAVLNSVTPGQMVIKVVHDELVDMLGPGADINLAGSPPVALLMLGLQGTGKTTTSAKIGLRLATRERKKVLLASLDVYRPAAQQQLEVLGKQAGVQTLSVVLGEQPIAIAKRAMVTARKEGVDVVILDSAGRLHLDDELMTEVAAVREAVRPIETFLVADAMTGQDALTVAQEFNQRVGVTGIVLTRADGDARGGAALSMRAVTGCPIKLVGTGEKLEALEEFDGARVAGRILGMGDVVGLVERAEEVIEKDEAEKLARRMMKGQFTLEDMAEQFAQIRKMGDVQGLLGMLPGIGKVKKQLAQADIDDKSLARQEAIILSMTVAERRRPKLLNGSRRKRIAAGSGTSVQEVNRVLKQFQQMSTMMKKMGKAGRKGLLGAMGGLGGLPPGFPPTPPPGR